MTGLGPGKGLRRMIPDFTSGWAEGGLDSSNEESLFPLASWARGDLQTSLWLVFLFLSQFFDSFCLMSSLCFPSLHLSLLEREFGRMARIMLNTLALWLPWEGIP